MSPDVQSTSRRDGVIRLSAVVGVEELLEPLNELKVVLEPALHQPIDGNDLVHVHLLERRLQV